MISSAILEALTAKCGWQPAQTLVVGVSGGADSVALLHILKELKAKVVVGHFNHHLRETAERDARFVATLCESWRIPFEQGEGQIEQLAKAAGLGIEEAARQARYAFLFGLARKLSAYTVVTAHHADDQVETVLMHFLRGAGLDGLGGMAYHSTLAAFDEQIAIYRPMLGVAKTEILSYCAARELDFVEDETNDDPRIYRNRLRNELLPLLETYNPGVRRTLLRNVEAAQADLRLLEALENEAFYSSLIREHPSGITLDRTAFLGLSEALRNRVIRRAAVTVRPNLRDFGLEMVRVAREAIEKNRARTALSDGLMIWCIGKSIQLTLDETSPDLSDYPQLKSAEGQVWQDGEAVFLENGWILRREAMGTRDFLAADEGLRLSPNHAWLAIAHPGMKLTVRGAKAGERIRPLGMPEGSQKLSDLFVNLKIPQPARVKWPVVLEGEKIIWVAGLRPAETNITDRAVGNIVHLWLERPIN